MLGACKKRKRIVMEMVGQVGDGMGKTGKQVLALWDLETDEDCGVELSRFPMVAPSAGFKGRR